MARAAVHYLAADPLLASTALASSAAAAAEFRHMVASLHAAGIEVLLMVGLGGA
jgi:pullulanase/glycogen debranching enzyme